MEAENKSGKQAKKEVKFIFVTGGVVSSLGKGIAAASLGRLLKARGYKVAVLKFDPYINVDPGTMSPYQHGEVYVTEDGAETDLDLGHYERFIDINLTKYSSVTTGKIYWSVLQKERAGEYLGATVQVIPHITDEIKDRLHALARESQADIIIVEIGGTVGDIESQPFLEAIRQMSRDVGSKNVCYLHLTLLPYLPKSGELKTKPTQHSVKELREIGIQPDVIMCRTAEPVPDEIKAKIALFCSVNPENVVQNVDSDSIYGIPLTLEKEGLADLVIKRLGLDDERPIDLDEWKGLVKREAALKRSIRIALVGKYVSLHDAYLSVVEALRHAGIANDVSVDVDWVDSSMTDDDRCIDDMSNDEAYEYMKARLAGADGVIVPGGFGTRGIKGMLATARYAREEDVPYFGICLGMQIAAVEYARNVLEIEDARSAEWQNSAGPKIIDYMPDQVGSHGTGGSMRLGVYPCKISEAGIAREAYGEEIIYERHRHRLEFNNEFRDAFVGAMGACKKSRDNDDCRKNCGGLLFSGVSPNQLLVEMIENPSCKWFVGVQFHPEMKSRPTRPHPLFNSFIAQCASAGNARK